MALLTKKKTLVKILNTFTRLIKLEIFKWLLIPHKIKAKSKLTQNAKWKLMESVIRLVAITTLEEK